MDSQSNYNTVEYPPAPPSSSAGGFREWWTRPIVTMPAANDERKATFKESAVCFSPCTGALLTFLPVFFILLFIDKAKPHANFSVQSISISPSSATWHVDFLVRNPSSRYSISYEDGDYVSVTLGELKAAVLNITTHDEGYGKDHTFLSLEFVVEGEWVGNDVVEKELCVKLSGKHKVHIECCCSCYSFLTIFMFISLLTFSGNLFFFVHESCYVDLFANSISVVSNANATATADWRMSLIAKNPVTSCKTSLHTIKSRLLRGDEVISELNPSLDGFEQVITHDETDSSAITVRFKKVMMSRIINGLVWDYKVEIVAGVTAKGKHGFLMMVCDDLPVKFTVDAAGNAVGTLLGTMRRCDYLFWNNSTLSV
ncbi:unnamed protein product [Cochlearia groenlandica]